MEIKDYKIVLASSSPRRKELLNKITSNFEVIKPDFDESIISKEIENKDEYSLKEAINKRNFVLKSNVDLKNKILLTCDTVIVFNNKIYGKPTSLEDAKNMLKEFSSQTHKVISGYTLTLNDKKIEEKEISYVTFKELNDETILNYINKVNVLDKAGSYAIQEKESINLIEKIKGYYDNIVGLPVESIKNNLLKLINE